MNRAESKLLSFELHFPLIESPFFRNELKLTDSVYFSRFNVYLFAGIEIDEELHVFAYTLPYCSLMENDVSFEKLHILYFFELKWYLLFCFHSKIIKANNINLYVISHQNFLPFFIFLLL
jgi:hypothetical protein